MGRTSIRRRLTLLFGITIVLVVALVGWFVSRQMTKEMFLQARRTGVALAGSIAASASNDFYNYNYVALEQKAEEAIRDPEIAYVVLYDKEGAVAAFSGQGKPGPDLVIPPLSLEELSGAETSIANSFMSDNGRRGFDILTPVTMSGNGARWGSVRLGLRLDRIYAQIERTRQFIFILGLAGVLMGWLLAALFTRRITVPLKDLVNAAVEVSEGNYDVDLSVSTGDEVQDLAENFQQMALKVKESRDALEANLKEIRGLKHFSDLIILSITNGLMTLDEKGRIITFNRKAEEILSVTSDEVLGKPPEEVWGKDNEVTRIVLEGLAHSRTVLGKELHLTINGARLIVEITTSSIIEDDGKSKGFLVLFDDLTEKKALEDRIRRADRLAAMGTLAAGLAHEIKNPLTAVRAFVQMFPDKFEREEFRDKFNRIVPKELDRVNELLEDLLDLVRKPRLKINTMKVYDAIDHVLGSLEPEIERRKVEVRCLGREAGHEVLADESYLVRAVHNVVLNAVQAMPAGGLLTIETTLTVHAGEKKMIEIKVIDTGPGIPTDQVDDIFNPFFTSKEKGTGLGLAVTNKIIEDQGGGVRVHSERAQGTAFIISLPSP
jgi:two-component system sensor histidine kinase AtoS